MCYYATTDYSCGDWKWGNMMERCPRQHRIGETCGAKLVHHESVTKSSSQCKICEEISTKQRRLAKTHDNVRRWSREPDKFSASLEKAQREAVELEDKIRELQRRRPSIATHIAAAPKSQNAPANMLPPLAASYEYQSVQNSPSRRQDSGNVPRHSMTPSMMGHDSGRMVQSPNMMQYATMAPTGYPARPVATSPMTGANMMMYPTQNITYAKRR